MMAHLSHHRLTKLIYNDFNVSSRLRGLVHLSVVNKENRRRLFIYDGKCLIYDDLSHRRFRIFL
jgi:hypothetical protein